MHSMTCFQSRVEIVYKNLVTSFLFIEADQELNWKIGGIMLILYWKDLLSYILYLCFLLRFS